MGTVIHRYDRVLWISNGGMVLCIYSKILLLCHVDQRNDNVYCHKLNSDHPLPPRDWSSYPPCEIVSCKKLHHQGTSADRGMEYCVILSLLLFVLYARQYSSHVRIYFASQDQHKTDMIVTRYYPVHKWCTADFPVIPSLNSKILVQAGLPSTRNLISHKSGLSSYHRMTTTARLHETTVRGQEHLLLL